MSLLTATYPPPPGKKLPYFLFFRHIMRDSNAVQSCSFSICTKMSLSHSELGCPSSAHLPVSATNYIYCWWARAEHQLVCPWKLCSVFSVYSHAQHRINPSNFIGIILFFLCHHQLKNLHMCTINFMIRELASLFAQLVVISYTSCTNMCIYNSMLSVSTQTVHTGCFSFI